MAGKEELWPMDTVEYEGETYVVQGLSFGKVICTKLGNEPWELEYLPEEAVKPAPQAV